ncbi:MAG: hypothetical protein R3Y43_04090 [Alphaproteobacteria bacterium]
MNENYNYLTGLKGVCGIGVTIFHYLLAYACFGYIGYESGIAESEKYSYYFKYFPYSILSNASFFLYVFFAIIAFLPAQHFFKNNDVEWIKKQAVVRYFRFMPYILTCAIITWAMYRLGFFYNKELGSLLYINWNMGFYPDSISFLDALKNGFYSALFEGDATYNSVFWCMQIIFMGSYLSYALLLFWGGAKNRWLIYFVLFALSFNFPVYTSFLAGVVAADIINNRTIKNKYSFIFVFLGLIFGFFPEVLLPAESFEKVFFGIGGLFVLLGFSLSEKLKFMIDGRVFQICGKYSFSLVIMHFPVMMSFSAWLFMKCYEVMGYGISLVITFVLSIPVIILATFLFQKIVEVPTCKLSNKVYSFLGLD